MRPPGLPVRAVAISPPSTHRSPAGGAASAYCASTAQVPLEATKAIGQTSYGSEQLIGWT
eukprot:13708453-Alexandrium_andersonii.AAC.1